MQSSSLNNIIGCPNYEGALHNHGQSCQIFKNHS
jgi:hypothetical protein